MIESPDAFWSTTPPELLRQLETTPEGLESTEAQERLRQHGPNLFRPKKRADTLTLLLAQFKSPIILILIFAAGLSFLVRDPTDAVIIIAHGGTYNTALLLTGQYPLTGCYSLQKISNRSPDS